MEPTSPIASRYELEAVAGAGGMGTVFRALDRETGARVAVKILARGFSLRERFEREARLLAALHHPGLVRYLDHGVTENGTLYLVMEWLEGEDLSKRLSRGKLETGGAVRLGRRVAQALGETHRVGIVHRDVKPSNLFLVGGRLDRVQVLDFGAATLHPTRGKRTPDATAEVIGTVGYAAPEQTDERATSDARSDVFSLGCVLYECITGERAFAAGDAISTLARVVMDEPPAIETLAPHAPPALGALIRRMMAKDPAVRPRDGSEVAQALAALERASRASGIDRTSSVEVGTALSNDEMQHAIVVAVPATSGGPVPFDVQVETLVDRYVVTGGAARDRALTGVAIVRDAGVPAAIASSARRRRTGALDDPHVEAFVANARTHAPAALRLDRVVAALIGGQPAPDGGLTPFRPAPFAGRTGELHLLEVAAEQSGDEGNAVCVSIAGPSGIGKTRLASFFLERTVERPTAWIGSGPPPPGAIAIRAEDIANDPDRATAIVEPHLDRGAIVVVDAGSHVAALARWARSRLDAKPRAPWLLVWCAREEPPEIASLREASRIRLGDLPARACAELVRHICGETPAFALPSRRTPRVIELLARAAAGQAPREAAIVVVGSELESLEPEARRVLRAASFFESPSIDDLLGLLGGGQERSEVVRWVDALVAREILAPSEDGYRFRDRLLAEAADATLTEEDRVLGAELLSLPDE